MPAAFLQMAVDKIFGGIEGLLKLLVRDEHEERVYLSARRQGIGILPDQSAIGEKDWAECPSCETTGYDRNNQRMQCKGLGWLSVSGSL